MDIEPICLLRFSNLPGYMEETNKSYLLSVVIPAFNEEKFLPACLASLKNQDFDADYEVIVVDNNSTDRTAEVALAYGARVLREPVRGVCPARQCGTEGAQGEIIVSTDADCIFPRDWLKNIYKPFAEADVAAVLGPFEFTPIPRWGLWYSKLIFNIVGRFYRKKNRLICAPASNFAFRRAIWSAAGGYNIKLHQGGDENDLLKRLMERGRIIYLPANGVLTSSRRLAKGIIYSLFITAFVYYFLDYWIASRITGKSILGQYPPYREHILPPKNAIHLVLRWSFLTVMILSLFFFSLHFRAGEARAKSFAMSGGKKIIKIIHNGIHTRH
jgi:glycosyltransferase involved in cell wall biosynthesis